MAMKTVIRAMAGNKVDGTTRAARQIFNEEAAKRAAKTAKLKAARLERDAALAMAKSDAPSPGRRRAPKPRD